MRLIAGKSVVAAMIIIAAALIATTAKAQSCPDGKLCSGVYGVENYSNPKHEDILIVVQGVSGANPGFTFAPNKLSEKLECEQPDIDNDGEDMACTKQRADAPEGCMETVRIGVIGGRFCEALRTVGHSSKVISPGECTHIDCACFLVKHHWEGDSVPAGQCGELNVGPPTEGTGSGGSP